MTLTPEEMLAVGNIKGFIAGHMKMMEALHDAICARDPDQTRVHFEVESAFFTTRAALEASLARFRGARWICWFQPRVEDGLCVEGTVFFQPANPQD